MWDERRLLSICIFIYEYKTTYNCREYNTSSISTIDVEICSSRKLAIVSSIEFNRESINPILLYISHSCTCSMSLSYLLLSKYSRTEKEWKMTNMWLHQPCPISCFLSLSADENIFSYQELFLNVFPAFSLIDS
jgi:hypothetical protein